MYIYIPGTAAAAVWSCIEWTALIFPILIHALINTGAQRQVWNLTVREESGEHQTMHPPPHRVSGACFVT